MKDFLHDSEQSLTVLDIFSSNDDEHSLEARKNNRKGSTSRWSQDSSGDDNSLTLLDLDREGSGTRQESKRQQPHKRAHKQKTNQTKTIKNKQEVANLRNDKKGALKRHSNSFQRSSQRRPLPSRSLSLPSERTSYSCLRLAQSSHSVLPSVSSKQNRLHKSFSNGDRSTGRPRQQSWLKNQRREHASCRSSSASRLSRRENPVRAQQQSNQNKETRARLCNQRLNALQSIQNKESEAKICNQHTTNNDAITSRNKRLRSNPTMDKELNVLHSSMPNISAASNEPKSQLRSTSFRNLKAPHTSKHVRFERHKDESYGKANLPDFGNLTINQQHVHVTFTDAKMLDLEMMTEFKASGRTVPSDQEYQSKVMTCKKAALGFINIGETGRAEAELRRSQQFEDVRIALSQIKEGFGSQGAMPPASIPVDLDTTTHDRKLTFVQNPMADEIDKESSKVDHPTKLRSFSRNSTGKSDINYNRLKAHCNITQKTPRIQVKSNEANTVDSNENATDRLHFSKHSSSRSMLKSTSKRHIATKITTSMHKMPTKPRASRASENMSVSSKDRSKRMETVLPRKLDTRNNVAKRAPSDTHSDAKETTSSRLYSRTTSRVIPSSSWRQKKEGKAELEQHTSNTHKKKSMNNDGGAHSTRGIRKECKVPATSRFSSSDMCIRNGTEKSSSSSKIMDDSKRMGRETSGLNNMRSKEENCCKPISSLSSSFEKTSKSESTMKRGFSSSSSLLDFYSSQSQERFDVYNSRALLKMDERNDSVLQNNKQNNTIDRPRLTISSVVSGTFNNKNENFTDKYDDHESSENSFDTGDSSILDDYEGADGHSESYSSGVSIDTDSAHVKALICVV